MLEAVAMFAAAAVADLEPVQPAQRGDDIVVTGQRTEGSDDYGVAEQRTATRLPLSQKDTPQSVSIVTRAQIQDFQLNSVNEVLATVPGVSVLAAETDRFYYSARGFEITTFQVDGIGQPFAFGIQTGSLDTSFFDRIEVVRGAPGLLSFTGNPSAVVNYVRKRPYRNLRVVANAQYGSFDNLRLDGDISVPLTSDRSIRARAVGSYLDTDSYLDRYHLTRWTGYGIVEADLGPNTVISAGYGHQDHDSDNAQWGAVPLLYGDGTRFQFGRDSNTGQPWSGWGVIDRQIFGDLTHDFGKGWTAKLSVLRRAIDEDNELFYVYGNPSRTAPGGINATTGEGVFSYPGKFLGPTRNLTIDAYVNGKVDVGGRAHDVMFGLQRGAERYRQDAAYDVTQIGVPIALSQLFAGTFPRPAFPALDGVFELDRKTRRLSVYGLTRLDLADALKVMLGGSWTHAESEGTSYGTAQDYDRKKFVPFVGATFALTPGINAYASYAKIFNPQTIADAQNVLFPPIEGDNLEAGLKGEWFGGRLYASGALFRVHQDNTAVQTGLNPTTFQAIYSLQNAKSEGVELEVGGSPLAGLQATGGFTFLRLKLRDGSGAEARTFVPRNVGRLNITYSPPSLPALKLGTSVQYQSRIYYDTADYFGAALVTGLNARITQGGYALVDLFGAYDLTDHVRVGVNVRNLTNKNYLSSLTFTQSYYGPPRTVLGTVTVRY
ncbi:outer-membrane receptor for ferric coprogen and ferric-rhodotorulic acid [Sphingomonas carotinifaciens]|nr:outer-membrane receptor for ferric coprogen and ferric-rhodotorulic acid [Sphingomonas carotinifaciens]